MSSPIETIKVGKIRLSIWAGEYQGKSIVSFTIDKPYLKEGRWQNGKSFSKTDLGNIVLVCIKATDVLYSQNQPSQTNNTVPEDAPF